MPPTVVLDRQHRGKPSAPRDRGAVFPDGSTEAQHAEKYLGVARQLLEGSGVRVVVITGGEYPDRNRRGNEIPAALYVACHVNGGDASYALTEYASDVGQVKASRQWAVRLLHAFDDELGQRASGPRALRLGERGHVCIGGCTVPAVILEPYFNLHAKDDALVGRLLARAICAGLGVPFKEEVPVTDNRKAVVVLEGSIEARFLELYPDAFPGYCPLVVKAGAPNPHPPAGSWALGWKGWPGWTHFGGDAGSNRYTTLEAALARFGDLAP